ncbi:hypothetical protein BT63DRAFT_412565 [Microthyrium microscopicum]|uniref:Uncharacterized protein n=1 Tax=Microthyrium microscopicum TaxID=703497 RepID=A0A6A6UJA9_9PEZI|nr:hypothetical protein BT63DRAFT_412565 [Microthyrium microscopicum]
MLVWTNNKNTRSKLGRRSTGRLGSISSSFKRLKRGVSGWQCQGWNVTVVFRHRDRRGVDELRIGSIYAAWNANANVREDYQKLYYSRISSYILGDLDVRNLGRISHGRETLHSTLELNNWGDENPPILLFEHTHEASPDRVDVTKNLTQPVNCCMMWFNEKFASNQRFAPVTSIPT